MSTEAIAWVLEEAPDLPPHLVGTLLVLAIYADEDGCGSFPSRPTIGRYARKTIRAVRNDLVQLEHDVKLIKRGDQSLADYFPADERPVVWNLLMARKRDQGPAREGKPTSILALLDRKPTSPPSGGQGSPLPSEATEGGEVHFPANSAGTGSPLPFERQGQEVDFPSNGEGREVGFPLQRKKKTSSSSPSPVAQIAAALQVDDEEAREIYNRIVADPKVNAPSRYIDRLVDTGDIAKFRTSVQKPAKPTYTGPTHDFTDPDGRGHCVRDKCGLPATHARHGGRA